MSGTVEYANPRTAAFRATLDRLPDEIALAIGLHVYDEETLSSGNTCVCGWVLREALARECGIAPENTPSVDGLTLRDSLMARFGGSFEEWSEIYWGVTRQYAAPLIEEALFDRVMAAALAADKPKSQRGSSRRGTGR